jgi:hypothetical protein
MITATFVARSVQVSSLSLVYLTAMLFYFLEANGQYRRFLSMCGVG